jgi:hypothetical protein
LTGIIEYDRSSHQERDTMTSDTGCAQVTAEYIRDLLAEREALTAERDAAVAALSEERLIGNARRAMERGEEVGEKRATAAIVAWLNDWITQTWGAELDAKWVIDAIERGEHLTPP